MTDLISQVAPTNSQTWEQPSREQLIAEGRKQARIYGVDPECAEVYGEGWAQATRDAQVHIRQLLKLGDERAATLQAKRDTDVARVAELERLLRCAQIHGYGYLLNHGKDQIALDPKDVTVVLPSTRHMDDFDLHNSLHLTEQRVSELELQREALLDECAQVDWISTCQVRETLGEVCEEQK